jgi:transcription antitermination factor NusG|tara:strand:- start:144 stop:434 length:291 start_codon:yes stop_codon:yes gene_type:complete
MDTTNFKMSLHENSIADLKQLILACENEIIRKNKEASNKRKQKATKELKMGDIVSVTGNKFKGEVWEVLKLNPKKVNCERENGEIWSIPYSNIILE